MASKNTQPKAHTKPEQSQLRKRLIARKEPFTCTHCQAENLITSGKQLNHCFQCLYSLHVDEIIPGDRLSTCRGEMKPATVGIGRKGEYSIIHECIACGKIIRNKAASNDNIDLIISLINKNPALA